MKVLLVNTFHHRRGGDATYSLSLLDLLQAHGHTVVPLAMRHPDNQPSTWERWFVPWIDYRDLVGAREHLGALRRFAFNPDAARRQRPCSTGSGPTSCTCSTSTTTSRRRWSSPRGAEGSRWCGRSTTTS